MPFIQSTNPIFSRVVADGMLGALSARPTLALLVTPHVHLFTAGPAIITPDSVPADFTEATFTGYAPQVLTLPLIGPINADANHDGVHGEVDFLAGAVTPPGETIKGYWIDDNATTPTTQYLFEQFTTPIPISVIGDYISLDTIFALAWQNALTP